MPKRAGFLTKPRLDKLRRDAAADPDFSAYVADAQQPGLYVRARRGRVGFVFDFRPIAGGHRRRLPLDWYGAITLEQARAIAQRHRAKVAEGRDPQEERRREAREGVTVAQAVAAYLEDLRKRAEGAAKRGKRSGYAEAKRRLERNVVPRLGGRRLKSITVADVRALHRAMEETPVEANRTLQALSAVYGFADLEGMIPAGHNPCRHVERNEETGERRAL
ncbi:MAG TPA: Arm DNA-binding domain-containing protein, partial [Thermoanaerobaculia bacterium]|nr:Arm DNA-binding domain-containing protein [Thermoanaerobaculia bacterium]